jgi:rhamnosyltransferase
MTIGVVIRTLNESELIGRCLETLQRQRSAHELDILVVDSGSTDATVAIAESHGVRVMHLSAADFDYSKALNAGIEATSGELVISLSAHAIPLDEGWLEAMAGPFADPRVAGVGCRQVPWPDAPWREAQRLEETFGDTRRVFTQTDQDGLLFSNAASCLRRSVWLGHPFTLPAVEDLDWARRMTAAGWHIVYEPATAVYHSHREGPRAQARRLIDINRVHVDGATRTRRRTLREAAGLLYRDGSSILALDRPPRRKVSELADLVCTASFYVSDFSRSGTTAERRRSGQA